jgi:hypothetical protein
VNVAVLLCRMNRGKNVDSEVGVNGDGVLELLYEIAFQVDYDLGWAASPSAEMECASGLARSCDHSERATPTGLISDWGRTHPTVVP